LPSYQSDAEFDASLQKILADSQARVAAQVAAPKFGQFLDVLRSPGDTAPNTSIADSREWLRKKLGLKPLGPDTGKSTAQAIADQLPGGGAWFLRLSLNSVIAIILGIILIIAGIAFLRPVQDVISQGARASKLFV
jgi:hypothetical protein